IASQNGSTGTLNISDTTAAGSLVQSGTPGGPNHEGRFIVGRQGTGTVNQSGGVVQADNWFVVGLDGPASNNPQGNGTYNMLGGQIVLSMPDFGNRNVIIGNQGSGVMTITNGDAAGDTIIGSGPTNDPNDSAFGNSINYFNVGADT